jgi:hypothetical protein
VTTAIEIPAAHLEHPRSRLDTFNAEFLGYRHAEPVGPEYCIFFTGLKPEQATNRLAGQWLGWPGSWVAPARRQELITQRERGPFFYAQVPGDVAASYRLGDHFHVADLPTILVADFLDGTPEQRGLLRQAVLDGRERLMVVMRREGVAE